MSEPRQWRTDFSSTKSIPIMMATALPVNLRLFSPSDGPEPIDRFDRRLGRLGGDEGLPNVALLRASPNRSRVGPHGSRLRDQLLDSFGSQRALSRANGWKQEFQQGRSQERRHHHHQCYGGEKTEVEN